MKSVSGLKEKEVIISRRAMFALQVGTVLAVLLYWAGAVAAGSAGYWYLAPNLILAYIPLGLTWPVVLTARRLSWKRLETWLWAGAWLAFLPNSFYLISDAVHLMQHSYGLDPLYGQVMFALFAVLGFVAGLVSLRAVHVEIAKRVRERTAYLMVELVLLLVSVGIYLGRTLRLNSWDVVLRPVRVAQDAVKVALHPDGLTTLTVVTFFVLLSVVYAAAWWPLGVEQRPKSGR